MKIRFATASDKSGVLALFDEFNEYLKAENKPSEIGGVIFDEIIERNDTKLFVVEKEGYLIGVATLYLLPNIRHGWHRGHIEDFFISAPAREQGVGTQLLNAIKDWCRENGIKVIKLDSGHNLPEAHSFYEKQGGKTTERFFRFDL